jgi:hypothetical protein
MAQVIQIIWCPVCHKYLGHFDVDDDIKTKNLVCACGFVAPVAA